jgi:hypothetical protein
MLDTHIDTINYSIWRPVFRRRLLLNIYLVNVKESKKSERILRGSSFDVDEAYVSILDLPDCCFSIGII